MRLCYWARCQLGTIKPSIIEVDGYAAKVNHQVITRNDVRQAMAPQLPEIYERFQGAEREAML